MHTELKFQAQVVEAQVDADCTISVRDQGDKFTLVVSSPGSKIAAIRISGISELQLKGLVQQAVNLL